MSNHIFNGVQRVRPELERRVGRPKSKACSYEESAQVIKNDMAFDLDEVFRYELRVCSEMRLSGWEIRQMPSVDYKDLMYQRAVRGIASHIYGPIYQKLQLAMDAVYASGIDEDTKRAVDLIAEAMDFCKP